MRLELSLTAGLQSDDTPNAVGQGGFVSVNNMRPWRGSMQVIGGWEQAFSETLTGVCRAIHVWTDNAGEKCHAYGTNSNLYIQRGGVIYDITPASDFTEGAEDGTGGRGWGTGAWSSGEWGVESTDADFPLTWSLDNFGQDLLANPRGQTIFRLDLDAFIASPTTVKAVAIANAPDEVGYMLVADEKRQVIAYGCSEEVSGDLNPRAVRFSDTEDLDDWTTATDNLAGEYITSGSGVIVAAVEIGDAILILTDSVAYLQTFVGSLTQVWRFDRLEAKCGLAGPNAVTTAGGAAYWLSESGVFWRYVLGSTPERLITPVAVSMNDEIADVQREKIFASAIEQFEEIVFHFPSKETEENDLYVAMNTRTGRWYRGERARTAAIDAGPEDYPIMVSPDGVIYWHELRNTANGGTISWHCETGFIRMAGPDRNVTVKQLFPDIHNQRGIVTLTITGRDRPQGDDISTATVTLTDDKEQADFFCTGRYISLRYSGDAGPTRARLGTQTLQIAARGRR